MIICLGWGSLIWSPRQLPIAGGWRSDGPHLPVEFARVAADNRLTLVVNEGSPPVPTLWTRMPVATLDHAIDALSEREGCDRMSIGVWSEAHGSPRQESTAIAEWAKSKGVDGVVWTALRPGFRAARGTPLSCRQALDHLAGLTGSERNRAEEYVRKAPLQTATPYRTEIERKFGWTPI